MSAANTNAPSAVSSGYGKSVACVLAGSGCALVVEVIDEILAAKGLPPLKASLVDAASTFVTTAAVFFTPHNALGSGQ